MRTEWEPEQISPTDPTQPSHQQRYAERLDRERTADLYARIEANDRNIAALQAEDADDAIRARRHGNPTRLNRR